MPLSIFDAARYILGKSPWTVTQLKLQKLLYLAQMTHLGEHDRPLVAARFEAWRFGPVNRNLYDEVKHYGADPLPSSAVPGDASAVTDENAIAVLDDTVNELADKSAAQLIHITHWKKGAWYKTHESHSESKEISERLMKEEYLERKELAAKTKAQS